MRRFILAILCLCIVSGVQAVDMNARRERKAIVDGNEAYRARNYEKALSYYEQALRVNPANLTALFNKALATTMIADNMTEDKDGKKSGLLAQASKDFESVARHTSDNPSLAARANYNRGNISFKDKKYQDAIDFYKNALRLNHDDDQARRNLRIAQQNLPKQNQDQNQNKNQNKDKDKDKDKEKNQDQNRNQDRNQDRQQQPRQQDMNNHAADRILKRSTDKENQTRKNFTIGNPAKRSRGW